MAFIKTWRLNVPIDETGHFNQNGKYVWKLRFNSYHEDNISETLNGTFTAGKKNGIAETQLHYEGMDEYGNNIVTSIGIYHRESITNYISLTKDEIALLRPVKMDEIEQFTLPIMDFVVPEECTIEDIAILREKAKTTKKASTVDYDDMDKYN